MTKKTAKAKPTREQLTGLAALLQDAPTISNDAQAKIWVENGAALGWSAMDAERKENFRARFHSAGQAHPERKSS